MYWRVREELSRKAQIQRSYYEVLRDDLDRYLTDYALCNSYRNFCARKYPYPFVEKRELKPRARIPDLEYECQNAFLVIFLEDCLPPNHKKYIRFFDVNKTTKANLLHSKSLPLPDEYDRNQKYFDTQNFFDLLNILLPVDYALLIQRDRSFKDRYNLSHFHVRIDWPIAEAAEAMGRELRYVSKDLYEKGEKYAEDIQKKFFEYYGLPVMAGGRRTAAIVAAQYLRQLPFISTVYVGSSETRALTRFSERGVTKSILMQFTEKEIRDLADENGLTFAGFKNNYVVSTRQDVYICVFRAIYEFTDHARSPEDGKLREVKPDLSWLSVGAQHILPKSKVARLAPIPANLIYT